MTIQDFNLFAPISKTILAPVNSKGEILAQLKSGYGKKGSGIPTRTLVTKAFESNMWIEKSSNDFRLVPVKSDKKELLETQELDVMNLVTSGVQIESTTNQKVMTMQDVINAKPSNMVMDDLKFKFLAYALVNKKNTLLTGPAGTGKSTTVMRLAKAVDRPFFNIPMASPDYNATIAGTVNLKGGETVFKESEFIRAIQTPNAIILMDELSRMPAQGMNLLMPVLDNSQRFLRLDEDFDNKVIKVAEGVTFFATANLGHEYVGAGTLDQALESRFLQLNLDYLDRVGEMTVLDNEVPGIKSEVAEMIADFVCCTREEITQDIPQISRPVDTREAIELASMITNGGFTLTEAFQLTLQAKFDLEEITFLKQILQKYGE